MTGNILNLVELAQALRKAVKEQRNIVIFSDSDLDGVTSAIILEETLANIGAKKIFLYFPDREEEGYGLTKAALNNIKKHAPGVLILADCGIGSFEEVKEAKKIGFNVLIIEHHEILDKLPEADIIVNPKQPRDQSGFKFLATCGLSFLIAREILKEQFHPLLERSFLELAAVGTVADRMPQEDINAVFVDSGLKILSNTARPGLKVFFVDNPDMSAREIVQKIVSSLQITKNVNHLPKSYLLLSSKSLTEARGILDDINQDNAVRRAQLKEFYEEIVKNVDLNEPFLFEGGKDLPLSITGVLASRLSEKFDKPVFVFSVKRDIVRGSIRSIGEHSREEAVDALKACAEYLMTYGGHPRAAGFSLSLKNLDLFKKCLYEYFNET